MSLKEKAVSGLLWSLWQQVSSKLVGFCISVYLARLLSPAEFGLIAMLSLFIAIGHTLLDSGLTASLVRTKEADQRDYSSVFYFNIAGSIFIYALLFLTAPLIADFYDQPLLKAVARVYGLVLIINAFFAVQSTLLIKEMKFKRQTNMQIPAGIGGGILGIVLAHMGYGVWSLVWMGLCTSFLSTAMHWVVSPWRPAWIFDKQLFKKHIDFGYKMTLSSILDTIHQNLYLIIIGKYFSASQLGFYSRADSISQLPIGNISAAVNKATYPMFAELSADVVQLKKLYKKLMQQVLFWNAPSLIFLSLIARPLFHLLLTDKWLPAVPYFQILCISGIMYPLHSYNLNVIKVLGKSALFLKLEILKKVLSVTGILTFIHFGIYGLLYFQFAFNFVAYYINSIYSGKLISYPIQDQIKDIFPILLLACIIGALSFIFNVLLTGLSLSDMLVIVFVGLVYAALYIGTALFIKLQALNDFNQLILKR